MKKLLVFLFVLVVCVGALGYWRGWFGVTHEGRGGVQVDSAKFKQDKDAFSKSAHEKAKGVKDQVAHLWKKSEGLTGDDKAHAERELADLEKKHDRLEHQLKDLGEAGEDKFEGLKLDLSNDLADVEKKIE